MMRCAASSALSEQRCRQFSATAARPGTPKHPAGPAKKLQQFESLQLLRRRDSVCCKTVAIR